MKGATTPAKGKVQSGVTSIAATGGGMPTSAAAKAKAEQKAAISDVLQSIEPYKIPKTQRGDFACIKHLRITIFFDGTGNNLNADLPTLEHSNVARMYRAHVPDSNVDGVFAVYVPGIGTLFPAVGDDGVVKTLGVVDTHSGMGAMGQSRLDFAFNEIQKVISQSEPRCTALEMISISVFGFSRGATLARAFLRDLLNPLFGFAEIEGVKLCWKRGKHPLEIRFVGLWDTVAAVGMAAGANNLNVYRSPTRIVGNSRRGAFYGDASMMNPMSQADVSAAALAFGPIGADPSPGYFNGHAAWADGLHIPGDLIAGKCVHMVAAHEQRNSFPLDSVMRGSKAPRNTVELVYPGMHTDVGGGYRPGEGGLGVAAQAGTDNLHQAILKASQVSLRAMYEEALSAGVPLRRMIMSKEWRKENAEDFATSATTAELFNYYMGVANTGGLPLGDAMLAHMRIFFAWRFQHIRSGDRAKDIRNIESNEKVFAVDLKALQADKAALEKHRMQLEQTKIELVTRKATTTNDTIDPVTLLPTSRALMSKQAEIESELASNRARSKEIDACIETLPSRGTLANNLAIYDQELLSDVRSILEVITQGTRRRDELRPHYRNLVEAYEAEFVYSSGLRDKKIIAFFNNHIHDSLSDFDADWTLPSDPRMIYVGGSTKLRYANLEIEKTGATVQQA